MQACNFNLSFSKDCLIFHYKCEGDIIAIPLFLLHVFGTGLDLFNIVVLVNMYNIDFMLIYNTWEYCSLLLKYC